jgi:hypothetical protein
MHESQLPNYPTYSELQSMSDEEVIAAFDRWMSHGRDRGDPPERTMTYFMGADDYLQEIHRRHQDRQTDQMLELTKEVRDMTSHMKWLTIAVALMTLVNLAILLF